MATEKDGWAPPRGRRLTLEEGERMVRAQEISGLSVSAFAKKHGLAPERLYWWRGRVGRGPKPSRQAPLAEFLPVRVVQSDGGSRASGDTDATLELAVGASAVIRLRRGFDAALLRSVVAALEEEAC